MNTLGGTAGGGEILQQGGQNIPKADNINDALIQQLSMLPIAQVLVAFLLVILAIILIFRIKEIKTPFKGKGINSTLNRMEIIRRRDEKIIKQNKMIASVTKLIEKSPFKLAKSNEDYLQYNLDRAGIKIPGGARLFRAKEFNAIIKSAIIILSVIGVFVTILINSLAGILLIVSSLLLGNTLPMMYLRTIVKAKDDEIKLNFSDFYLMLHYVLIASANTPLEGIMKSYAKTTSSEEMIKLVDTCVHYIDTYGEYGATRYIARQYREIPEIGKLMRLIRQANDGGDVKAELIGFRQELLNAKKYEIEKRMSKLIARARASFNLLLPVLVQAVISAMAIYISDLGIATSLFSAGI